MFASKTDIQAWVRSDKILVDDANSQKPNIEAARVIRGQLAGVFSPIVIASWADPDTTPELIRSIAGRLAAAYLRRSLYSEESGTTDEYSTELYTEALAMLAGIKSGAIAVTDDSGNPIDLTGESLLGFWPNDTIAAKFSMDQEFA